MTYAQMVGERLRNIRLQKRLSLHDVELASNKEFKASVLGAYERGERSISVPRLQRLARFYSVPVDHLLPRDSQDGNTQVSVAAPPGGITIDLKQLGVVQGPETTVLQRYLNMLQVQRGDFNGKVLTIRQDDLRVIASALEQSPEALFDKIDSLGIKAGSPG